MAKKKSSRQKHQKDACEDDTSDEELKSYSSAKACSHVAKAVNLTRMKKSLKTVSSLDKCKDCKEELAADKVPSEENSKNQPSEIWLCLQCGYYGCGRTSTNKHAIAHFKTPRSDCHAVVLSTSSMSVWCYSCDDSVLLETSRNLRECVDFISKLKTKQVPNHVMVNGISKGVASTHVESPTPAASATNPSDKSEKEASALKPKQNEQPAKSTNAAKKNASTNRHVIKGLRNLGNTCFFNAVIQNLCQTPWLREELEQRAEKGYQWEISFPVVESDCLQDGENPLKVPLLECYPLTQSFLNFLKQMVKASSSNKIEVLNPSALFDQICKKSPQFRGFHQQDSHELLRHLLDGIRNEEIKRQKKAILKVFNLSEKVNPEEVDEDTKQLIKAYGSVASHTVVDRIFGGQLLSTVVCEECKVSSQVFEPFMDLSLPLAEEKVVRGNKIQKHIEEDENSGMYALTRKKENQNSISKHQEKKLQQQAKKAAKKKSKIVKRNPSIPEEQKEEAENAVEENGKSIDSLSLDDAHEETARDCNDEHSDADVEDNDESENVTVFMEVVEENLSTETVPSSSGPGCDVNGVNHGCALDERIEELCNQITDIRIRRDSDKQDDLLESMDENEKQTSAKRQRTIHSTVNIAADEVDNSSWSRSQSEQQAKEWMMRSLTTLKARYQPSSMECSVNSCLNQFTASELLTGSNKFRCENCTNRKREQTGDKTAVVYSNASKQMLIFSPPAVLTLHLKRFQQTGMCLRKLNLFVEFPQILDLAPYCSSICLELPHMAGVKDEVLYSLYAVVQHSGKLTSGHYTAYVKLQENSFNPAFLNMCPVHHCSLEQLLKKISKVKANNTPHYSAPDSNSAHKWYYISDSYYKEVSESEVMHCQAYLLFYQRIK